MVEQKKVIKRRDATGHLDAGYQRKLLESSRERRRVGGGEAFVTGFRADESLAEELGEAFVASATSGEAQEPGRYDQVLVEEEGGPFVRTGASQEFAYGLDESNIAEATREPLPKTSIADP